MKISELKVGEKAEVVSGTIKNIGDTRAFNKYGKDLKVANAILEDESGTIKLSLWNDDITRIKNEDKIKITNGFVSEFNSEKQLSAGKYGNIEVVGDKEE